MQKAREKLEMHTKPLAARHDENTPDGRPKCKTETLLFLFHIFI